MPLLADDFHESGDESLVWECEEVEHFPDPDYSVQQIQRQQLAFRVCRGLVDTLGQAEIASCVIPSDGLQELLAWARQALPSKA